jgi:excisionase family DNA binding protein
MEDRLVYSVEEAAKLLGISRSLAYEAVHRGEVPSMRIGRRILVPKAALKRYLSLAGERSAPGQAEPPPATPA